MGDKSKIEWTDATWNPVVGCSVISPGCTNCYAMKMAPRLDGNKRTPHYAGTTKQSKAGPVWSGKVALASDDTLMAPLRWRAPRRIFVNSMGDLFHESIPNEWIDRVFAVMALCPQHTFQVLTKRALRQRNYFTDLVQRADAIAEAAVRLGIWCDPEFQGQEIWALRDKATPLPNVWLGVSSEDQERADERIPHLLQTPAAVRFVSCEPLLGAIRLNSIMVPEKADRHDGPWLLLWDALSGFRATSPNSGTENNPRLDWVIVGSESGTNARPCNLDWVRSLIDQCSSARTPLFWKQHVVDGRKISTPEMDGRKWVEFPR